MYGLFFLTKSCNTTPCYCKMNFIYNCYQVDDSYSSLFTVSANILFHSATFFFTHFIWSLRSKELSLCPPWLRCALEPWAFLAYCWSTLDLWPSPPLWPLLACLVSRQQERGLVNTGALQCCMYTISQRTNIYVTLNYLNVTFWVYERVCQTVWFK